MADENKIAEDTNNGGSASSGRRGRSSGNSPQQDVQPKDAFQEYKAKLKMTDIPSAQSDLDLEKEERNNAKKARRNKVRHLNNVEQHQREYQAIRFNITSIMAQDGDEIKKDVDGLTAKLTDLTTKLATARASIIAAKEKLRLVEEKARQIEDAKDDGSAHSEQKKLLNRIVAGGGKKNFDDAISEIVEKADEAHNLSDNAREKEIIVEGIVGYINVSSLDSDATSIKDNTAALNTDVQTNITSATTAAGAAKTALAAKLSELSTAAMNKDRSKLALHSLNETVDNIDNIAEPDEDIREILQQVDGTFESDE